jgi:hypothetical protein
MAVVEIKFHLQREVMISFHVALMVKFVMQLITQSWRMLNVTIKLEHQSRARNESSICAKNFNHAEKSEAIDPKSPSKLWTEPKCSL